MTKVLTGGAALTLAAAFGIGAEADDINDVDTNDDD